VFACNARSFNDETLDSMGNKGCIKYFEHRHPYVLTTIVGDRCHSRL
jgi:hypothetical protein